MFVVTAAAAAACSGTANIGSPEERPLEAVGTSNAEVTTEDGLADAYALFKSQFTGPNLGFDKAFPIGYGYHPGLSTEKLSTGGLTPKGQAKITFALRNAQGAITTNGSITATLEQIPAGQNFDLWFVKNIAGSGRTVKPETGDTLRKVGSFTGTTQFGGKSLSVVVSPQTNSDLDIFRSRHGRRHPRRTKPTASRIVLGSRTLFEKRFFRERAGQTLDPVPPGSSLLNTVETNDPLVQRGAFLFFNETFGGNSRTCGNLPPPGTQSDAGPCFHRDAAVERPALRLRDQSRAGGPREWPDSACAGLEPEKISTASTSRRSCAASNTPSRSGRPTASSRPTLRSRSRPPTIVSVGAVTELPGAARSTSLRSAPSFSTFPRTCAVGPAPTSAFRPKRSSIPSKPFSSSPADRSWSTAGRSSSRNRGPRREGTSSCRA